MPLPSNLVTITVTGTFLSASGNPLSGEIIFTPPPQLIDLDTAVMCSGSVTANLDSSGHFSVTLLCTDNPTLQPLGWSYTVNETIGGNQFPPYQILLPGSLGASVDLTAVKPLPFANVVSPQNLAVPPIYAALVMNNAFTGNNTFSGTSTFTGEVTVPAPVNSTDAANKAFVLANTTDTGDLLAANNLSDLPAPATARTNLGLGSAATVASSAFDTAGAASAAQSAAQSFATSAVTTETSRAEGVEATKQYALIPAAAQSANFTAAANTFYPVNAGSGSVTATLPAQPADGTVIAFKMTTGNQQNQYTVGINVGSGDYFNTTGFTSTRTLALPNQAMTLQYQGATNTWFTTDSLPLTQLQQTFPTDWINVKKYGAAGNGKQITDASMTASSATLTSASQAAFTTGDIGKLVVVSGAGALNGSIGVPLAATITAWISSTQVTLSASATTSVSGATCTYGSDDKAYIQAAITACANGQTVFLPAGTFMISAELSIAKPMRLTGDGTTVCATNSAAINFQNTYISAASGSSTTTGLEIDHLVFDVSGGHVFYNTNFNRFSFHDLRLVQRSYNYAAWYSTSATSNQLDGWVHNVTTRVYGDPRTVPAWYILSAIGGGLALAKWQNCLWQNNDLDTTQYCCWFECTGTHNYLNNLSFDHCWFDSCYGGAVKLLSVQGADFRACDIVDSYSATWGGHGYYIGASTAYGGSEWPSQKISFRSCSRDLQGPNGTASWDIYLEAATDSVVIDTYLVRDIPGTSVFYPYFNFNGCTNVTQINCNGAVVTNQATSYVDIGPGGNINLSGALTGAYTPATPQPTDMGYQSYPFMPEMASGSGNVILGEILLVAQFLRYAVTLTGIVIYINTGLTGGVSNENYVGLFTPAGALVAVSADCTSTFAGTGGKKIPFTAPVAAGGSSQAFYWAAILSNGSAAMALADRPPTPGGILNIGTGATTYRYAYAGGSSGVLATQTVMPSTITPSNNGQAGAAFWVGTY